MRVTDHRYAGERNRFDLALRMIRLEARTCTIRQCTGLSDDRIRKLYKTYFPVSGLSLRRRRGKPPRQTSYYFKSAWMQFEATTLAALAAVFGLMRVTPPRGTLLAAPETPEYGHLLCQAFETYKQIHKHHRISFEHAWGLFDAISKSEELVFETCKRCDGVYLHDALDIVSPICPGCRLKARLR